MLQMQSKTTHQDNIKSLETAVQKAKNADLLVLPEYSGLLDKDVAKARKSITTKTRDPFIEACCYMAKAYNLWIHIGSTPIKSGKKILNHSALINNHGFIVASYDKIHMFDIFPVDRKPIIESKHYKHGENAVLVDTPWGGWGMSVCYDLRFPHLYRRYAQNDAKSIIYSLSIYASCRRCTLGGVVKGSCNRDRGMGYSSRPSRKARRWQGNLWALFDRKPMGESYY